MIKKFVPHKNALSPNFVHSRTQSWFDVVHGA